MNPCAKYGKVIAHCTYSSMHSMLQCSIQSLWKILVKWELTAITVEYPLKNSVKGQLIAVTVQCTEQFHVQFNPFAKYYEMIADCSYSAIHSIFPYLIQSVWKLSVKW